MLGKGKVTAEELRQQLGDRLPGAFGLMAKAVGVGVEELDKMMANGELLSGEVLPKFGKELRRAANEGGAFEEGLKTINARTNLLKAAWADAVLSFNLGGGKEGIASIMDSLTRLMVTARPLFYQLGNIIESLSKKFEVLTKALELVLNLPVIGEKLVTGNTKSTADMVTAKIEREQRAQLDSRIRAANSSIDNRQMNVDLTINTQSDNPVEVRRQTERALNNMWLIMNTNSSY